MKPRFLVKVVAIILNLGFFVYVYGFLLSSYLAGYGWQGTVEGTLLSAPLYLAPLLNLYLIFTDKTNQSK